MSASRPTAQSQHVSTISRTGDGGCFSHALNGGMSADFNHAADDGEEIIRILSVQLGLTRRQAEVLHWVAQGKTNEETATILGCGYQTIKTHLKDIYLRLGVNNRAGAIGAAYDMLYRQLRRKSSAERGMPEKSPAQ